MIERHIILFTSNGCAPCKKELEDLSRFRKLRAFPKKENRFIIVNILDKNHSMWVELFRPTATPELKIIDIMNLKVEKTFSGVGCINAAWSYLNISVEMPPPSFTEVVADNIPPIENSDVSGDMDISENLTAHLKAQQKTKKVVTAEEDSALQSQAEKEAAEAISSS
jgi:hypothetical protein